MAKKEKNGVRGMSGQILAVKVNDVTLKLQQNTIFTGVSFEVNRGEILGLMGRNGTGKTMLLRCIEGLIPATEGDITVNGKRIRKDCDFAPETAFVIEPSGFLTSYSAFDNLRFLISLEKKVDENEIRSVLQIVGLDPLSKKKVRCYSKGMLQRLNIAQVMLSKPRVLLLDEPMNGLDFDGVQMLRNYLKTFASYGGSVLIASHYKEDMEGLCDHVYKM